MTDTGAAGDMTGTEPTGDMTGNEPTGDMSGAGGMEMGTEGMPSSPGVDSAPLPETGADMQGSAIGAPDAGLGAGLPESGPLPDTATASPNMAAADMEAQAQTGGALPSMMAGASTSPAGAVDTTVATTTTTGMMGAGGAGSGASGTSATMAADASGLSPIDPIGASAAGPALQGGADMTPLGTDTLAMNVSGAGVDTTEQRFTGQVVRQGDALRFVPDSDTSRNMRLTRLANRSAPEPLGENETDLSSFEGQHVSFVASDVDGIWIYGVDTDDISTQ
jgi:hypothetical protein